MNLDDLMILMTWGGIGLSIAYLRAEFDLRSRTNAASRRAEKQLCDVYATMRSRMHGASHIFGVEPDHSRDRAP